ncbi:MAG TPA: hypothetical protein VJ715_03665 [Pyrinomonadaceae bacterium]|nr:hypothetical protein [Pyrinomonadaceae bacterium]
MDRNSLIEVAWRPRPVPLAPVGLAAHGPAATNRLARRLLGEPDEVLSSFRGVSGPQLLLLLGGEESLPWVDAVTYLGRDERAPSLLLPTTLEPSVPLPLLERALAGRFKELFPCALLVNPGLIVPLAQARAVARQSLVEWLKEAR